jgi:hypothetical protein
MMSDGQSRGPMFNRYRGFPVARNDKRICCDFMERTFRWMPLARSSGDRVDQFSPAEAPVDAEMRRLRRIMPLASWARNGAELGEARLAKSCAKEQSSL